MLRRKRPLAAQRYLGEYTVGLTFLIPFKSFVPPNFPSQALKQQLFVHHIICSDLKLLNSSSL